jgi:hypothetical protein
MSDTNVEANTHRTNWRELSRNLTQREILYFVAGSPDGVSEKKIKTFMHEVFKYSFNGSVESYLEKLEDDGLLSKEYTRSSVKIWHANQLLVIDMVKGELEELKYRENELRDLHSYLISMYAD